MISEEEIREHHPSSADSSALSKKRKKKTNDPADIIHAPEGLTKFGPWICMKMVTQVLIYYLRRISNHPEKIPFVINLNYALNDNKKGIHF